MTILMIEHAEGRTEGLIDEAEKYGSKYQIWKPYTGEIFNKPITEYQGLIIGGGPMGAYEIGEYPFFKNVTKLIEEALAESIPTFGICLGAQILAQMLGCKIEKTFWRRGYLEIKRTYESMGNPMFNNIIHIFPSFQYHKDEILELPNNSVLNLTSDNCTIEGFHLLNHPVWAIQSHPEISRKKANKILWSTYDLEPEEVGQMLKKGNDPNTKMNSKLFENFFKILEK